MFKNKNLVLAILFAISATPLLTGVADADDATVIVHADGCMVFDLAGNLVEVEGNASGDATIVVTQSANENWNITCHGTLPESSPLPDRAIVMRPEGLCGIPGITPAPTTDFLIVMQPSGQVTLSCHYKASK